MKNAVKTVVFLLVLLSSITPYVTAQTMSSGWHWPTGYSDFCGYLGWLGYNPAFSGYHLGQDMCNNAGLPVYSIGDGEVISSGLHTAYGCNGLCQGGCVLARYQAADGTWFTAMYGHLDSWVGTGQVCAGQIIGYTRSDWNPPHLHFSVQPGYDPEPTNPWRGYTSDPINTYGFVDPIPFLNDHPSPIYTGLVAYYPFNGNANDESGNGNNGTVHEAILTSDRFGNVSSAYNFDGVNDYIQIPYSTLNHPQNSITLIVWFKIDYYPTTDIVSTHHYGGYGIEFQSDKNLYWEIRVGTTSYTAYKVKVLSTDIILNKWHFVAGTYDGNVMKIYFDGVLKNQLNVTGPIYYKYNNSIIVAADAGSSIYPDSYPYLRGSIDDILIYNRALTDTEILALYNCSSESNIIATPSSIDFGNVNVGNLSDITVTVENNGTNNLTIGSVTLPSLPFSVITDNCTSMTLAPSATCSITVRFAPITSGTFNSSFDILSNDPDTPVLNIPLRGVGVKPDLIISSLIAPTTGVPGSTINITDTTKNQGTGTASPSTTKFYWSTNATYDAGDTLLGSRAVPALAVLAISTGTTTVTVPAGACSGTFYIIAKADADNVVAETKETNNTKYKTIKTGPDLIISALTAPTTSGAGKTILVTDTTKNNGGCPAGATTTKLYFSNNSTWDAADTYLGERPVPALAAGATDTGSTSVTIPAGTSTGTRYIIAKADANAVVTETSETNNNKSKSIKIGPDLIVSLITVPTSAVRGSTISVTDTTKNNGGGDAGASTTKLYLSTNTTWDAGDTYLGSRSVPMLTAGASSAGSTSVTIPSGIATGPYYIIALTDDGNVVVETNETNNKKTKAITINP